MNSLGGKAYSIIQFLLHPASFRFCKRAEIFESQKFKPVQCSSSTLKKNPKYDIKQDQIRYAAILHLHSFFCQLELKKLATVS